MVDVLGSLGLSGGSFSLISSLLLWLFVIIIVFVIVGGIVILWLWNKSFNQKITLKAKVSGVPQIIGEYKAKWIKIAGKHSNERLLYIRTIGRWELPRMMSGKNHWVFWRREQDGEWINIIDEDVDEKAQVMRIKFIDGDVRMQRVANEKVLRDRLQKKKDWMAIIAQIGYIIVFIFLILGLVILFTQLKTLSASMAESAGAIKQMAESVDKFYKAKQGGLSPSQVENGDTGALVPATPPAGATA